MDKTIKKIKTAIDLISKSIPMIAIIQTDSGVVLEDNVILDIIPFQCDDDNCHDFHWTLAVYNPDHVKPKSMDKGTKKLTLIPGGKNETDKP